MPIFDSYFINKTETMRTINFNIILIAMALSMFSCDEWEARISTEVFSDGSCVREVSSKDADCLIIDEGWSKTEIIADGDTVKTTILSRRFNSVEEMGSSPVIRVYDDPVRSETSFDKRFKWFYTDYIFTETFLGWSDRYDELPVSRFMTQDEASYMLVGYPAPEGHLTGSEMHDLTSELEGKLAEWKHSLLIYVYVNTIAHFYGDVKNPPVDLNTFIAARDSLAAFSWKRQTELLPIDDEVEQLFSDFFKSDAYSIFFSKTYKDGIYEQYGTALYDKSFGLFGLSASYMLKLPGKVFYAGPGTVEEDRISYRFKGDFLVLGDYTITASSRVVNAWTIIVTILAALAAGILLIKKKD